MKKTLLTMAAALALVGCSNDDLITGLENNGAQTKGAVGVNTFVPTITRGAALNSVDDLIASENGFDLISFYNTGTEEAPSYTLFMGTETDGAVTDGIEFKHDGSAWDYADRGEIKFWQELEGTGATDMKFFAVSPTISKWTDAGSYSITADAQTITYTVPTNVSEQVDIMYAQKDLADGDYTNTSDAYTNGVPLNFHHALSQIVFKAKIADKEDTKDEEGNEGQDGTADYVTAHVNSITVKNVYGAGTFDMDAASSKLQEIYYGTEGDDLDEKKDNEDYNYTLWTTSGDATNAYEVNTLQNASDITWTEAAELTVGEVGGDETALMLLPQQLEGLDLTAISGGNSANEEQFDTHLSNETGAYLMVNCRVEYNGNDGTKYIVGTETEYANLYIPISTQWNPGYKYVYTLIFSADSGDPVKATVESVDEWNTYTEEVPETGEDDNTGDEDTEKSEDELTQAELNARLIANQFASANAATITADGVTFIENEDYMTRTEYDEAGGQYRVTDEFKAMYYSYKELNEGGLLGAIPDDEGNYWRVATADEWSMLVFKYDVQEANQSYPYFFDEQTTPYTGTETVTVDGTETSAEYTFGLATAFEALSYDTNGDNTPETGYPIVATRFKGTKQHAAYKYAPITLSNGLEALEITIKGLKSNAEVTFDQINSADFWAEGDCFKVVLPAVGVIDGSNSGFYDDGYGNSGWYGTADVTDDEYASYHIICYLEPATSPGEIRGDTYGDYMNYPVRMIQCDAEGNLVLE